MLRSTTRHLYDRPVGVFAVLVAVLVLGGMAIPGMRIRLFTGGEFGSTIYVSLGMPGMSTRETLDRLTRPAEEIARSLSAVGDVHSNTSSGRTSLQIQPAPGTPRDRMVTQLTQAFISHRHRFPAGMQAPSVNSWSADSLPLMVAAIDRGNFDADTFSELVERQLVPAIQAVPGVAKASPARMGEPSVRVALDALRLAALRMDAGQVANAVGAQAGKPQSFRLPAGADGNAASGERQVRIQTEAVTPASLPALRLDARTSLADIATIETRDPALDDFRLLVNGKPGEMLVVNASADANVYRASREVGAVIERECAKHGLTMRLVFNSHEAFNEVAREILISAGWCALFSLVFLVLFLGRWRLALLVCTALPLSLLMAVIAMAVGGSDLSLLSLIGFLLASGMVIDNAIVIAESLLRARETSDPGERRLVLRRAASAVAMAIIVSTLTTVAMFLPVVVTGDGMGRQWLTALALPIVWSLIGSLVVALVLVPMAFARLYPRGLLSRGRTTRGHVRWLLTTERWYGRTLAWLLLRPALGLTLTMTLIGGGALALLVFPPAQANNFNEERVLNFQTQQNYRTDLDTVTAILSRWHTQLVPHRERLGIVSEICHIYRGQTWIQIYLTPIDPLGRSSDQIEDEIAAILTPDPDLVLQQHTSLAQFAAREVQEKAEEVAAKAKKAEEDAKKSAATIQAKAAETGPGEGQVVKSIPTAAEKEKADTDDQDDAEQEFKRLAYLSFDLSAPEPQVVNEASRRLREVLIAEGGVPDEEHGRRGMRERPQRSGLSLALSRSAEEQGWRADQVASQVARFTGGDQAVEMAGGWRLSFGRPKNGERTLLHLMETVVFQTPEATAAHRPRPAVKPPTAAGASGAAATGGKPTADIALTVNAPLLHLVEPSAQPPEESINRTNGLTQTRLSITVRANQKARILANFPALLTRAHIPDGVAVRQHEESNNVNDGVRALWIALFAAAAIIYLLMCILYESLLAPLTVMTTVPAGIVSVMGAFTVTRLPMDQMVVLGLFLLVGIVINHGVVLVDRIGVSVPMWRIDGRRRTAAGAPNPVLLAIAAACRRRFAPVLLTSLTTIAGAVPMAFSHGRIFGAPIASLGLALAIGLTAATVFTLVVVPVVYQWLGFGRAGLATLLRGGRSP